MQALIFFVFGALTLAGAFGVVLARNPVHSALSLVVTLVSVAVLFIQQDAHLLAAVQVVVYAGAIVVLFLFVIMLLGVDHPDTLRDPLKVQRLAAIVFGLVLLPAVIVAELRGPIFAMDGTLVVSGEAAVVDVVVGLMVTAAIAGASVGWLITRDRRAAGSMAIAALALALGPGHNIPLLGGTPVVAKELAIVGAVVAVAAVVLVEVHTWLTHRGLERDAFTMSVL